MPKLNTETAGKVENAEDGFKPVPDGMYVLELRQDVEVREGDKGPYWSWEFEIPADHDGVDLQHAGRRFWENTSLSENSYFRLKQMFAAFGVPANTETEDLVKRRIKAVIVTEIAQRGKNKGNEQNRIEKLLPLDSDAPAVADTVTGGSKDQPLF